MEEPLNTILSDFKGEPDELIPILQQAQAELGYLPEKAMLEIAKFADVPESRVYAVATSETPSNSDVISRLCGSNPPVQGSQL